MSTRTEATRSPAADVLAAQPHPARGEACAGPRAVYVATAGRVPNTASVLISRLYGTGTVAGSTAFVFDDRRFPVSPHGVGVLFRLALGAKSELSLSPNTPAAGRVCGSSHRTTEKAGPNGQTAVSCQSTAPRAQSRKRRAASDVFAALFGNGGESTKSLRTILPWGSPLSSLKLVEGKHLTTEKAGQDSPGRVRGRRNGQRQLDPDRK